MKYYCNYYYIGDIMCDLYLAKIKLICGIGVKL